MGDDGKLLQVARQLTGELQQLQMDLAVQRSAYLLLVRRLAGRGAGLPGRLAEDLETMGRTQRAPAWQALHLALAGHLRLMRDLKPRPPRARLLQRARGTSSRTPCGRALCG